MLSTLNALFAAKADEAKAGVPRKASPSSADIPVMIRLKESETQRRLSGVTEELKSLQRELGISAKENEILKARIKDLEDSIAAFDKEKKLLREEKSILGEEKKILSREKDAVRGELIEILDKYKAKSADFARLKLSIASALAGFGTGGGSGGDGANETLEALRLVSENARSFSGKTLEFCDYLEKILQGPDIGKVEKARIRLKMDELRAGAGNLGALLNMSFAQQLDECRLLAVNDKLNVVVLAAGFINGVRNGLNWRTGKDRQYLLRIVAVRPYISAAVLVKGNIKDLSPGMIVYLEH